MRDFKVVAVEPGKEPYEAVMSFEDTQKFVGGYVEPIHLYDDKYALVNEEGVMQKLEPNRHMILQEKNHTPLHIVGNFVVVKSVKEEYGDLNEEELKEAMYIFRSTSKDATIFI
jgi:hypothetical protein